jgi:hypothetical protein
MKSLGRAVAYVLTLVILAGCSSTKITDRQAYEGAKLAKPDRIIVHDFTADPADVPPESDFADKLGAAPPASEQAAARKLGSQVAQELVADLRKMGLPAVAAAGQPAPQVDDIVLRGYFITINEGSATERVLVGFGEGDAELHSAVEAYQMTPQGLRLLGHGQVQSGGGGSMPGVIVPLAVVAATANPIGLVVGGAAKLTGEATGSGTIEGAAKRTAEAISAQLKIAAEQQGWI